MTFQQGSEHVQFVDACDEDEAIKKLISAIADGGLRAQWGIGRRAAANEFRNRVLVYPLEGTSVFTGRFEMIRRTVRVGDASDSF